MASLDQQSYYNNSRVVVLPSKHKALGLLHGYLRTVACLHPILYGPVVQAQIENLYRALEADTPVNNSHVALALSVFASAVSYWSPITDSSALFLNSQDAHSHGLAFTNAALDVLAHIRRTESGSLEAIQATVILSFVVYNIEGISTLGRSLGSSANIMARDIGLHRIDALSHIKSSPSSTEDLIAKEMERRVFWQCVSTEWYDLNMHLKVLPSLLFQNSSKLTHFRMLSLAGGPQQGTYFFQPRQIKVRYPKNIMNDDLPSLKENPERELTEVTPMSYFILRVQFSEICREVVDTISPPVADFASVDYDDILRLDAKFQNFIDQTPTYLRIDQDSQEANREIDVKMPELRIQRYIMTINVHCRRIKLNQPYLIRSSLDKRYAHSRNACLNSARIVIQVKRLLEKDDSMAGETHLRLFVLFHHIFLATVALVMDLCFNRVEGHEEVRKAEVASACKILQDWTEYGSINTKFVDSLDEILKKHNIWLNFRTSQPDQSMAINESKANFDGVILQPISADAQPMTDQFNYFTITPGPNSSWPDMASSSLATEMIQWDNLFSELDSGFS